MAKVKDGKYYLIMNIGSKTMMDAGGTDADRALTNGYELLAKDFTANQANQIWEAHVEDESGPWYSFKNLRHKLLLDNRDAKPDNGNPIQIAHYEQSNKNQQWLMTPVSKGGNIPVYVMYNRRFKKSCIDLEGGKPANGTKIQLYTADPPGNNTNQMWMLIEYQGSV